MTERTYREAVEAAIHLLSTNVPTTQGRYCSSANLTPVNGPTPSGRLYIAALQGGLGNTGSFEDGIKFSTRILEEFRVARDPENDANWTLVEADNPSVGNQLYIAELQRMVNPDG